MTKENITKFETSLLNFINGAFGKALNDSDDVIFFGGNKIIYVGGRKTIICEVAADFKMPFSIAYEDWIKVSSTSWNGEVSVERKTDSVVFAFGKRRVNIPVAFSNFNPDTADFVISDTARNMHDDFAYFVKNYIDGEGSIESLYGLISTGKHLANSDRRAILFCKSDFPECRISKPVLSDIVNVGYDKIAVDGTALVCAYECDAGKIKAKYALLDNCVMNVEKVIQSVSGGELVMQADINKAVANSIAALSVYIDKTIPVTIVFDKDKLRIKYTRDTFAYDEEIETTCTSIEPIETTCVLSTIIQVLKGDAVLKVYDFGRVKTYNAVIEDGNYKYSVMLTCEKKA